MSYASMLPPYIPSMVWSESVYEASLRSGNPIKLMEQKMSLKKGKSKKVISDNIKVKMAAGKPKKQAIAMNKPHKITYLLKKRIDKYEYHSLSVICGDRICEVTFSKEDDLLIDLLGFQKAIEDLKKHIFDDEIIRD